jgi:hypothetical protein
MGLQIISADERLAEKRGVKALILGKAGVGKTSLLRTIDPQSTLFLDLEAGNLSVQDVPLDELRPQTWPECRDLACFIAGPNENISATAVYGRDHYKAAIAKFGDAEALDKYETLFIDSITVAGRLCFAWCEQQPESYNAKGDKDLRSTYGLHGREMVAWITRLQHARTRNVVFVCLLDEKEDDFGRKTWSAQIDGSKTGREMPGIVDVVLTMAIIQPEEGDAYRALVSDPANEWGYPAKDRSGRLDALEPPNLGKLFTKLNDSTTREGSAKNYASRAATDTQSKEAA